MTRTGLWLSLAVLLPAVASLLAPMSTVDLTYQLRAGDLMLASREVLRTDPFTFSVGGEPWLDQQWGAQVLLAVVFDLAGWPGLALLRALLVAAVVGGVIAAARLGGLGPRGVDGPHRATLLDPRAAAAAGLATFAIAAPAMALRPQLLGMALFALVLDLLAARERWSAAVWLVPLACLAWANVHGSFALGPATVGVVLLADLLAGRPWRRLALVGLAALAATVVSPFGAGTWSYAVGLLGDERLRTLVTEWQPPTLASYAGLALAASAAIAMLFIAVAVRRILRERAAADRRLVAALPVLAFLAGLAWLALGAERGIAWWGIGAPVAVAGIVAAAGLLGGPALAATRDSGDSAATDPAEPRGRRVFNLAVVGVLVAAGVALLLPWRADDPSLGPTGRLTDAPADVTLALREIATPADRLFAPQPWGSWLTWSVPDVPIFVDSRIELFPADVWADHLAVTAAEPGWQAILDRWGVTIVVVAPDQPELLAAIGADPGWQVADVGDGTIATRADP
jgi:hypothetical protein